MAIMTGSLSNVRAQEPDIDAVRNPTRVYYSVFVQSFCDSNGDGIGDLPGLTSKLDYLKELGIGGLWLLPVHPSPTYHKYDVTDYLSIHPDYGTLNDYKSLVDEAHKRGMVVLLDLVVNHTSNRHPWFEKAVKSPSSPYRNYYIWSENQNDFETNPWQWHKIRDSKGNVLGGPRYYGFFWWEMPDLNFNNPKVRQEIIRIAEFWLKNTGIDGFRLDAARHIYDSKHSGQNIQWWNEFGEAIRKIRKDAFIVGEVWDIHDTIAPYLKKGLSACFNFQLSDSIRKSLAEEKDHHILQTWWRINDAYRKENPRYQDAIFLTNHDMTRIMSEVKNNPGKAKVAASLLLTLPGNPFIYYGEEIGMLGDKPDEFIREPFLWNIEGEDKGQTYWEIPYASSSNTVKPLIYQKDDPHSLYSTYKGLIRCRNESPALQTGWLQPLKPDNQNVIAFIRSVDRESVMVLINLSGQIQKITLSQGIDSFKMVFGSHNTFKHGSGTIFLQPWSTFILKQNH